jgi:hypothetical protein
MIQVHEAIAYTREWIDANARQMSGFVGAHLMGGVLAMPKDALFPAASDLDFNIVCEGARETKTYDIAQQGLILEYSVVDASRYCAADDVLANPELACNLAADSILTDPHGLLASLHQEVAAQYACRRWVQARCDYEKQVVHHALEGLSRAGTPHEAPWPALNVALFLSGLMAEASLQPPTHRRSLVLLRNTLGAYGRADLHEALLCLVGFANLTRPQVERYLGDCADAFDRATAVTHTPVPFQYKFQPHVRPYIVDGAREMIEQGCHREAMFWISGFLTFANAAIQADAPAAERPLYQAKVDRLLDDLGFCTMADVRARAAAARDLAAAVFDIADTLIDRMAA